eukprot:TRINITY_DN67250_c6_g1_i1.p1 TRINITY_DN67250_c6_g1~~TRINITY_DN67250_c6_g1_i1.p1  ORF type:complete len:228 (-),score=25.95 TRINITY_DN67250_c6_g1_i1:108-791(-)
MESLNRTLTAQYTAAGDQLQAILSEIDCSSSDAQEVLHISNELAEIASWMNSKDTKLLNLMSAVANAQFQRDQLEETISTLHGQCNQIQEKTVEMLSLQQRIEDMNRAVTASGQPHTQQQSAYEVENVECQHLRAKMREYRDEVVGAQQALKNVGLKDELTHEKIMTQWSRYADLCDSVRAVDKKLRQYQELPPDINLAKLQLEHKRQEAHSLAQEFAKQVKNLEMR